MGSVGQNWDFRPFRVTEFRDSPLRWLDSRGGCPTLG
jgi:hypothetical protein